MLTETTNYTEAGLVAGLKKRESAAFRFLYQHYRGSLFAIINQIVPDTETANDVLQETFIIIWKNIDKYDDSKGRLFTWLLNLTRNSAINMVRSKGYKNTLKNEDLNNFVNNIDTKESLQLNVNQIGLRKEVSKLKMEFREVLELSYFRGFTQEEVSKALNIPLGTVKTRLRSAIIELRKQFS